MEVAAIDLLGLTPGPPPDALPQHVQRQPADRKPTQLLHPQSWTGGDRPRTATAQWKRQKDEPAGKLQEALFGSPALASALMVEDQDSGIAGIAAYSFLWPSLGATHSLFQGALRPPRASDQFRCLRVDQRPRFCLMSVEIPLPGGNVSEYVVRVGDTVRKPATASTPAINALLEHLSGVGYEGAPRAFGFDDQGRQVIEYIPGDMADALSAPDAVGLLRVGRLIRELHDAVQGFTPPPDAHWNVVIPPDGEDLVCHHDLAPWNLVVSSSRQVFIDWDGAGPGTRLWDLAYAAHGFVPMHACGDPRADAPRLRALADGYGLDETQRAALPELVAAHTRGMYTLLHRGSMTGEQPWARLWAEGHGDHWGPAADYIDEHVDLWRAALMS